MRIIRLLAVAAVSVSLLAPAASTASASPTHCATTYTRVQFHQVAGRVFDGRDRATTNERRRLHRVVACQRFARSRSIIRLHLERYRHTHLLALEHARAVAGGPRAIALWLLRRHGLLYEWPCLDQLVYHESSWDPLAVNPSSGALGLGQALPPSKMAVAGADYRTNPETQLRWLIFIYSPARYGGLCNAWAFWLAHHYY